MIQFLIALSMLFSTIVDGKIVLDPPVDYQIRSLDDLWYKLNNDPDWQDWGACPDRIPSPWITLEMVGEMFIGKPTAVDNQALVLLSLMFFDFEDGIARFGICNKNDTIIFYGDDLRELLIWLTNPDRYFASGYYEELLYRVFK